MDKRTVARLAALTIIFLCGSTRHLQGGGGLCSACWDATLDCLGLSDEYCVSPEPACENTTEACRDQLGEIPSQCIGIFSSCCEVREEPQCDDEWPSCPESYLFCRWDAKDPG